MADSLEGLVSRLKQAEKVIDNLVKKSAEFDSNMSGGGGKKKGKKGGKGMPSAADMPAAKDMSNAMANRTALRAGETLSQGFGAKFMGKMTGMQQVPAFDPNGGSGQFERMQEIKRANEAKMQKMKNVAQTAYLGMNGISNRKTQVAYGADGQPILNADGSVKMQSRFSALSPESQANITSSMYGLSDTVKLMQGMQGAINTFLPGVEGVMGRATGYYNAGIYSGTNAGTLSQKTFGRLSAMSAITSPGSDAKVAQYLASRGMSSNQDVYGQTMNTIGNAARYMNISNEDAASSIEGLTSAKGASSALQNFGIYTADLSTGKEKTQGQIFEELAQRLTAGRGQANQEQTMASIRRGALGVTIDSFFSGDKQGAQMFKQYMMDRATGGNKVDLSSSTDVTNGLSSKNPLASQMAVDTSATAAMDSAQASYISGINQASNALMALNDTAGALSHALGGASAMIQTLFGANTTKGLIGGVNTAVDFTSKGLSGIGQAFMGMDMSMPPISNAPALAEMGIIAGSMGASMGVALASSAGAALIGGFGGFGSSNSVGMGSSMGTGGTGGTGPTSGGQPGAWSTSTAAVSLFDISQVSSGHRVNTNGELGAIRTDSKGLQSTHGGTDYNYDIGDAVRAVADGVVLIAVNNHPGQDSSGNSLGNYITIVHGSSDGEYTSIYGHLSEVKVKANDAVSKGQVIGKAGNSGRTEPLGKAGAHLHFEIRKGRQTVAGRGTSVNPDTAGSIQANSAGLNSLLQGTSQGASLVADPTGSTNTSTGNSTNIDMSNPVNRAKAMSGTPSNITNAMNTLSGLYSGDTSKILNSVQAMAANLGMSSGAWNQIMSGDPTKYSPVSGNVLSPDTTQKNNISNNVSIVVQVPDVTSADAVKFAQLVKQYLDDNSLLSNTGGM